MSKPDCPASKCAELTPTAAVARDGDSSRCRGEPAPLRGRQMVLVTIDEERTKMRLRMLLTILALGAATTAGCAETTTDAPAGGSAAVPPAFVKACGHPGSIVVVATVPVTVKHRDYDLTGVTIRYGLSGAIVPPEGTSVSGQVDTVNGSAPSITIDVAADTLDVAVR